MSERAVFTENLLALLQKNSYSARELATAINRRCGNEAVDYSYVARIIKKAKTGEQVNPSLEKSVQIARGFGLTLGEMLTPNYIDNPISAVGEINMDVLSSAYAQVESFCDELKIDDLAL